MGDYFKANHLNFENVINFMQIPIHLDTSIILQKDDKPDEKLMERHVKNDPEIEQCDLNDVNNPQCITQYAKQIFKYLRESEVLIFIVILVIKAYIFRLFINLKKDSYLINLISMKK